MRIENQTSTPFPPPPRVGPGEAFPSGWFGLLFDWIRSGRPIPDNKTIFGIPTPFGMRLSARVSPAGSSGSGGTSYEGDFAASATKENDAVLFAVAAGYVNIGLTRIQLTGRSHTPAANDATYAYLKLVNTSGITPSIEFCLHDALPANTATLAVYVLAKCTTDSTGAVTAIVQHHYGEAYAYGRVV